MALLVTFKTFGKRADPVGMVCRFTGGGAITVNDRGSTASLVT